MNRQHEPDLDDTFTSVGLAGQNVVQKLAGKLSRRTQAGDEQLSRSVRKLTAAMRQTNRDLAALIAAIDRI